MELNTTDYLKKALLDTQERIRDFQDYATAVDAGELQTFFHDYALSEARHAQKLQGYIESYEQ